MEHKHSTQKINLTESTAAKSAQKTINENVSCRLLLSVLVFCSLMLFVTRSYSRRLHEHTDLVTNAAKFFFLCFIFCLARFKANIKKKLAYLPLLYIFLQSKEQKIWIKKSIPIGTCMLKKWKFCILLGYVCSLFPCNVFMNRICWKYFVVQLTAFFALI